MLMLLSIMGVISYVNGSSRWSTVITRWASWASNWCWGRQRAWGTAKIDA